MHAAPLPAPPEAMVHYLAVFRRAFDAIAAYAVRRDRAGLVFGGWLADALHNVPDLLWRYEEASARAPVDAHIWLERGFREQLRFMLAPPELLVEAERIMSAAGAPEVLALPAGASDVRLPPNDWLERCLDRLSAACLAMRGVREFHDTPLVDGCLRPWADLDERPAEWFEEQFAFCGELARALSPLTAAMVSWPSFDPQAFERNALARLEHVPEAWREMWVRHVTL